MSALPLTPSIEEPIRLYRPERKDHGLTERAARRLAMAGLGTILTIVGGGAAFALWAQRDPVYLPPEFSALVRPLDRPVATPARKQAVNGNLLNARADYVQTFTGIATPPATLCEALADAGFDSDGWQPSLADQNRRECMLSYAPGLAQSDGAAANLFAVVRGSDDGGVASIFVKLNLLDKESAEDIRERATQLLSVLRAYPDVAPPPSVIDAVAALRPADLSTYGGRFRFSQERDDPNRYNLVIRYATRLAHATTAAKDGTASP